VAELITLAEFYSTEEAYLLKTRLESNGIPAFLQHENINALFPSLGTVKVQVNLRDGFKALDLLYED